MEELPDYSSWSTDRIHREYNCLAKMTLYTPIGGLILCFLLLFLSTGCSGTWVWQEDYPKHRTMSFKCPRWNYNEAFDELHHIYSTRQHEPINDRLSMEHRR